MSDPNTPREPGVARDRRARNWMRAILAVSLALNVFIIAIVFGAHARDGRDDRRMPPNGPAQTAARDLGFGPFVEALPRDARVAMLREVRERGGDLEDFRAELRAELEAIIAIMRADEYDATAMNEIMTRQSSRAADMADTGRELLLDQYDQMGRLERRAFADKLERFLELGPHGRGE